MKNMFIVVCDKKGKENLPDLPIGQSRDKLGEKAKVSGRQYSKGIKIKDRNTRCVKLNTHCSRFKVYKDTKVLLLPGDKKDERTKRRNKRPVP